MSAYICTDDTIKAVAIWAHHSRYNSSQPFESIEHDADVLFRWNAESVSYRYHEGSADHEPFKITPRELMKAAAIKAVDMIKVCDSLHYQSCEKDSYAGHPGYNVYQQAKNNAISRLPGMDDAPWGLDFGALA